MGRPRVPPPVAELHRLYHEQQMSTPALARYYGVSKGTIYNWFAAFGIAARSISAGVTLAQTGKRHTPAHNAAIARGSVGKVCDHMAGRNNPIFTHSESGQHYSRGGRRADLDNRYFRSRWESNWARYLNWLVALGEIQGWEYEVDTFEFAAIKRGNRSYTPDFKVTNKDGSIEYHEVKGWMDDTSRVKLDRMARYYPDVRIVLIDGPAYKAVAREMQRVIPHWETG